MCLYIITQLTGAALHIAQDERESVLLTHFMFPSADESHVHAAHGTLYNTQFKKHSHPLPLFSKANKLMLVFKKIIYVKTKW